MHSEIQHIVFGSPSSLDADLLVVVDELPLTIQDCKIVIEGLEDRLQEYYDKKVNVNLGVIENGIVTSVMKGTADEVNNSIAYTAPMHIENKEYYVKRLVERDVERKIHRAFRIMCSMLSRTSHRTLIKGALKGTTQNKIDALDIMYLPSVKDLGKTNMTFPDYLKTMAFQIGQTLALIDGKELYTKEDIGDEYPGLRPYLQRDVTANLQTLQWAKNALIMEARDFDFQQDNEY